MKIAMVLAISVIFTSGIYAANAEEPIPILNFEGGDYTVYKGNSILKTIKKAGRIYPSGFNNLN